MIVTSIQNAVMWLCVAGLAACVAAFALFLFGGTFRAMCSRFRGLDGTGRIVVLVAVVMGTMYGGSKWIRVPSHSGDTDLQVVGIYTQMSNDVVEVEGAATTNQIPMVRVEGLGSGLATTTPVWVRMSDTNEWTQLAKTAPVLFAEGSTNVVEFIAETNCAHYTYWFAGIDTPAVIRPVFGITVTGYHATGLGVTFEFECSDPRCEDFEIKWKLTTEPDSAFRTVATGTSSPIFVPGFWVDRSVDWRISSSYLEDGE